MATTAKGSPSERREQIAFQEIREALRGLQYGSMTVIVQDGIVVQIDRTSKRRMDYSALDKVSGGEGV